MKHDPRSILWTLAYRALVRPLLFQLSPEAAHHVVMAGLRVISANPGLLEMLRLAGSAGDMAHSREVFGIRFPNPVGLAAGFDKNAEALAAWGALGFGFVEAGTITAKAQPGNPTPRCFRYPDLKALVNRMGFNNPGADAVALRLEALRDSDLRPRVPVGLNLGKSKITPLYEAAADYLHSFRRLFDLGDYFVINVSSPNTPGLRTLQGREELAEIFKALQGFNRTQSAAKPLLVKIAPDLEPAQIEDVLALAEEHRLDGIVATNTTLDHSALAGRRDETGGLSGAPLRHRATGVVRFVCSRTRLPVIASGGIMDADSAREKLDCGAALIQLYTGYVYRGPALVAEILRSLPPNQSGHTPASASSSRAIISGLSTCTPSALLPNKCPKSRRSPVTRYSQC